jgi:Cdc6-like AAA superfamily ATPase
VKTPGNPYRTAPGSIPPELAGRDGELAATRYAIEMTKSGAPAKPIIFTGLRGMGKTALLRRGVADAREVGGLCIVAEADQELRFGDVMRRELEAARTGMEAVSKRLTQALSTIVEHLPKISYEQPNEAGSVAISGAGSVDESMIRNDALEDTLLKLNEELRKDDRFLVIAIDEIQESARQDILRVIRIVHQTAGTRTPILLIGAGLPNSPSTLKAARTYTERYGICASIY